MPEEQGVTDASELDVTSFIDGQRIGTSAFVFLLIATSAMVTDGFDIAAMGFVVPELAKQWHVAPAAFVPALSAGVFGLLCGAPLFGYLGDRYGRRTAILGSLAGVGMFSLATTAANSLNELAVLRFITGVALGGLIPNIIALAAEVAPKRLRGVFIIIVNFGLPAGFAVPGWVAALLVPHYGWTSIMLVGGLLPLLVAGLACVLLPESIAFLIRRGGRDGEVRRLLRAMRPDLPIDDATPFEAHEGDRTSHRPSSPAQLFSGGLAFLTPIFWVAYAANQFSNFFTLSWLPTLLQSSGLNTSDAGVTASMFSVGGLAGGIALTLVIDRFGALPMVFLFLVGAPLVAAIGLAHLPPLVLGAVIAGAGFCVTGNNFGASAVVGMLYPTAIRSLGAGWAQAFGRLGSLAAQVIGGLLLARGVSMGEAYLAPALALVVGAGASGIFNILCHRRFGGYRLDEPLVEAGGERVGDAGGTAGAAPNPPTIWRIKPAGQTEPRGGR